MQDSHWPRLVFCSHIERRLTTGKIGAPSTTWPASLLAPCTYMLAVLSGMPSAAALTAVGRPVELHSSCACMTPGACCGLGVRCDFLGPRGLCTYTQALGRKLGCCRPSFLAVASLPRVHARTSTEYERAHLWHTRWKVTTPAHLIRTPLASAGSGAAQRCRGGVFERMRCLTSGCRCKKIQERGRGAAVARRPHRNFAPDVVC